MRGRPWKQQPVLVGPQDVHESIEVGATPCDEAVELLQLGAADRRLHVRQFQVVADMAVDVLVIEAMRQRPGLLAEPCSAGVVLAASAVTVSPPVAERPGDASQLIVAGHHTAAFTHGDVMRGVEGHGGQMTERAGQPLAVPRPQRVAVVLDDPQVVFLREVGHDVQVERHTERVRHHDRAGPGPDCLPQLIGVGRVVAQVHIDEDRHQVVLQDRCDRRGERRRHGHDFIARLEPPIAERRRGQRRQRHQVGRRPRVHQERVGHAQVVRKIQPRTCSAKRFAVRKKSRLASTRLHISSASNTRPAIVHEIGIGLNVRSENCSR